MLGNNRDNIIRLCELLAEQENLTVTIKQSARGALIAGVGALFGGLLAGPIGLAIGGSGGSIIAAITSEKFKSVSQVLKELTPRQKAELAHNVQKIIANIQPQDYVTLLTLITGTVGLKEAVIKEIGMFLMREMNMALNQ